MGITPQFDMESWLIEAHARHLSLYESKITYLPFQGCIIHVTNTLRLLPARKAIPNFHYLFGSSTARSPSPRTAQSSSSSSLSLNGGRQQQPQLCCWRMPFR